MVKRLYYSPTALVKLPNIFGDGSDGAKNWTTDQTLTGDVNATTIVIASGVTIHLNGYRLFATRSITNNGTIENRGGNALAGTGGTGANGGNWGRAGNGGGGRGSVGNGVDAEVLSNGIEYTDGTLGRGGSSGGNTGGFAGQTTNAGFLTSYFANVIAALEPISGSDTTDLYIHPSFGGGGGAVSAFTSGASGAGGGGGGWAVLCSPQIVNTNGTIDVRGGNGSAAAGTLTAGGGAGGNGGVIILIGLTIATGTTLTTGGSGGAGVGGGNSGTSGYPGAIVRINGV